MNVSDDEKIFLRDLVKVSRQKSLHVNWTDRDGTARLTALSQSEVSHLDVLSRRLKLSRSDLLRQAAHIPIAKSTPPPPALPPPGPANLSPIK